MRAVATKLSLFSGIICAALALLGFTFPFIAIASGTYEGGEQSFLGFILYIVFAMPATALLLLSAYLRGWRSSRVAYYTLGAMFGIPLFVLIIGIGSAIIDNIRRAKPA